MLKLHLISFQFLLFLYALLSKNSVVKTEITSFKDSYLNLLNNSELPEFYVNILAKDETINLVKKRIYIEILREAIYTESKSAEDVKHHVYMELVKSDFKDIETNSEQYREEFRTFLGNLVDSQINYVLTFFDSFNKKSSNLSEKIRHFENVLYQEDTDVYNKEGTLKSNIEEIKENENRDQISENSKLGLIRSFEVFKTGLSEKLNIITSLISDIKKFKLDAYKYLYDYKDANEGDEELLESLGAVLIRTFFSMQKKSLAIKEKYIKLFQYVDSILKNLSHQNINGNDNVVYDLSHTDVSTEVEDHYHNYLKEVSQPLNIVSGNDYYNFEKLVKSLASVESRLSSYGKFNHKDSPKKDFINLLETGVTYAKEIDDQLQKEHVYFAQLYDNLYEQLNMVTYDDNYSVHEYNYVWETLRGYNALGFLKDSNSSLSTIDGIRNILKSHIEDIIKIEGRSNDLVEQLLDIDEQLDDARITIGGNYEKFRMLTDKWGIVCNSRTIIERHIMSFRKEHVQLRDYLSSYDITSRHIRDKIDNIIGVIVNVINHDNALTSFKKIRKMWKSYINYKKKEFKRENALLKAYEKDKNIIFPNSLGLSNYSEESSNVNKTFLNSPYFVYLHKEIIKKYDNFSTQKEMFGSFKKEYRSVDMVTKIIKVNRRSLKYKYEDMRKELVELIKAKKYANEQVEKIQKHLILLENIILSFIQRYISNKVNFKEKTSYYLKVVKSNSYKDIKQPSYYEIIEKFIIKRFLTMNRWRNFIRRYKEVIPSHLIYKIEKL